MTRVAEAVCIVFGFFIFVWALIVPNTAGLLAGLMLMNTATWMPCVTARLARLQRWARRKLRR